MGGTGRTRKPKIQGSTTIGPVLTLLSLQFRYSLVDPRPFDSFGVPTRLKDHLRLLIWRAFP